MMDWAGMFRGVLQFFAMITILIWVGAGIPIVIGVWLPEVLWIPGLVLMIFISIPLVETLADFINS